MVCSNDYTVGWLCGRTETFLAAQLFLDTRHDVPIPQQPGDANSYTRGTIDEHNIVIAAPCQSGQSGTVDTAETAADMLSSFPCIKLLLLVGIAGGAPSETQDIRLGDVVVGTGGVSRYSINPPCLGQQLPTFLQDAITGCSEDQTLGSQLNDLIDSALSKYTRIRAEFKRPPLGTDRLFPSWIESSTNDSDNITPRQKRGNANEPVIHYGVVASGDAPVRDAHMRDELAAIHGALCFDTESAGAFGHASLAIRGISNYADSHKDDRWIGYAAMAAAACAKILLRLAPV